MAILSFLGYLISEVGQFLRKLLKDTEDAFNDLPKPQQDAAFDGAKLSQILKDNLHQGETFVIDLVAVKLGKSFDVAKGAILYVAKQKGITTDSVKEFLDKLADEAGNAADDIAHNSIFKQIGEFAAYFFGAGTLQWLTISLGVIEVAYQLLKGRGELPIGRETAKAAPDGDPVSPPTGPKP